MRLKDEVAVVTGAGSGIGLAIAERFAAEGASLIIGDWNADRLQSAINAIADSGGAISGIQGDISDREAAEALVDLAISTHGRIDILVNNAGVMDYMQGVGELTDDVWRRVMSINVDGPMFTMRKAVPQMIAQESGSIINVASVGGVEGGAAGAAYTASKHALIGLTRNTAWVYATQHVRCNAICPGGVRTNIAESMPADRLDPVGGARAGLYATLMPSMIEPDEVAGLALYLASDESTSINGAIIPIDAGWTAA